MSNNEVEIIKKIEHPNIIKLFDIFESENTLYFVMEVVDGGDLFDWIIERDQYSEENAKQIVRKLFSALEYLHSLGIFHGNLKPENLLVDALYATIKVADFGLNRVYGENMMATFKNFLNPVYIGPSLFLFIILLTFLQHLRY
uniref:Protein kinase domain-containing protein n=1 Tax=Arcella intermedia TaxID=1963864 RepID=A0A6B2LP10_9EUKA